MGLRVDTGAPNSLRAFRVPAPNPTPPPAAPQVDRPAPADAGLARSGALRRQLGPLLRDVEATQSASNLIATADAGLREIGNLLGEIRESAISATNTGGISEEQIEAEQDAVDSAIANIDRIAPATRIDTANLLDVAGNFTTGNAPIVTAQAPRGANPLGFLSSLATGGENSLRNDSTNAVRIIDQALDQVNSLRGFLGALESDTLQPNSRSLGVAIEDPVASESEIRDLDFAAETADFTRSQVLFGQEAQASLRHSWFRRKCSNSWTTIRRCFTPRGAWLQ